LNCLIRVMIQKTRIAIPPAKHRIKPRIAII